MRSRIHITRVVSVGLGALLMVCGLVGWIDTMAGQKQAREEWQKTFAPQAAIPGVLSTGVPSGTFRIFLPRLGVERFVYPQYTSTNLKRGPAWLENTALPGTVGNSVIAAHRDTHFRFLRNVERGDEILVTRGHETYEYRVQSISIVNPQNRKLLRGSNNRTLTLVTCYPFYFLGPAPKRFVVQAVASGAGADLTNTLSF